MDVCEPEQVLQKQSTSAAARKPLASAENNNGVSHESRTRETSSRHRSPSPAVVSCQKRNPSPTASNLSFPSTPSTPYRSTSVKHTVRSSSSTPVQDATEGELFVRKQSSSKLTESLWPSTMRSLTVSFQSDAYTLPISKREKPVSHASYDCMTRMSSNVTHKQAEAPASRKSTTERKRSPLKGKNSIDQLENSKPVDNLPPRLVDQQLWPSRTSGKLSSTMNGSVDLMDKTSKTSLSSLTRSSSLRRFSMDGTTKSLFKSSCDLSLQPSSDDNLPTSHKLGSSMSADRLHLGNAAARALYSHTSRMRSSSPSVSSPSIFRGESPSRFWAPPSHKGSNPTKLRQPSPSRQFQLSNSVLSFIVDMKRGKKAANHIDDVHQLRMFYNRYLQWRYVNGQAEAALQSQKVKAEKMLCSVRRRITILSDSIMEKRILLQQMDLQSKLHSILSNQLTSLDDWALIEKDHISNVSRAIQDLQACTIRLPVTAGAKGETKNLKAALSSAVDIMQALVTSLHPTLPRMEEMNSLLYELAVMAAHERAFLSECESVLCSIDTLQVEEHSLRTQLLQLKS